MSWVGADWQVDPTMLTALNEISTCQSAPTQDTMEKSNQLMDHASMHPGATIRYHASDMILMTHINAA